MHILYRILWIFVSIFSMNFLSANEEVNYDEESDPEEGCYCVEYEYPRPRFLGIRFYEESPEHAYVIRQQNNSAWPGARGGDFIDKFSR